MAPEAAAPIFHPERLIAVLGRFKVSYAFIGGIAARMQGFPWMTAVSHVAPARTPDNFEQLAVALRHLSARIYTEGTPAGLPFEVSADALAAAQTWSFVTSCGRLDVSFAPPGTTGFDDIARGAVAFDLHGERVLAASLDDLVRIKRAAERPEDRYEIVLLNEMIRRRDAT